MTWKKFSEEKPRENSLIIIKRDVEDYYDVFYYHVGTFMPDGTVFVLSLDAWTIKPRGSDEWQEVEE